MSTPTIFASNPCQHCGGETVILTTDSRTTASYECRCQNSTSVTIIVEEVEQATSERELLEESARQFSRVINRQRRRAAFRHKSRLSPQIINNKPRHPFRLRQGNANRFD